MPRHCQTEGHMWDVLGDLLGTDGQMDACTQERPHSVDGGLLDVVRSLNERYSMAPKGASAEPSYHRSGVFAKVGLMEIDSERNSWINHRSTGTPGQFTRHNNYNAIHQNITSFSFLRSDILSKGLYGTGGNKGRMGTIVANHLFVKGSMFEILCAYPTDGGSILREGAGCGEANPPRVQYNCDGQCSSVEPPVTDPEVWIARMNTRVDNTPFNPHHIPTPHIRACGDFSHRISKECSIPGAEFDSFFVPVAQRFLIRNEHFQNATACDQWGDDWPVYNEIVAHMPPLVSLAAFPVEAFFHMCGEPPCSTLTRTIAEYKRVLGLQHVPLVCVRMVENGFFADPASPFEPSPYHMDSARTIGYQATDNDVLEHQGQGTGRNVFAVHSPPTPPKKVDVC